jgi:preprotein translocase subunit YajC
MNVEQRIAAVRAGRASQTAVATVKRTVQVQQAKPEALVEIAPTTETVFDIANNAIAKVMERGDLTDKSKLEAVVQFLNAKDVNYSAARKNFAEFEVYFTYAQSKRTQVSEENIQRLMDELADGTKSTVKHILDDFNAVNTGAGKIKQLLRVMEKARSGGKTVEVLTEAYRFNENLLHELAGLKDFLATDQKQAEANVRTQTSLEEEKAASTPGRVRKLLFGNNERLAEALYYSTYSLKVTQAKILKLQQTISEKEAQRNSQLEDGELTILRTVDATEGGLTGQILETARDSLTLIKGTRLSIERLLAANARSRAACSDITTTLNRMAGRETILKGALQVVARQAHEQGEALHRQVDQSTREKSQADADDAALTLLTVELDNVTQTDQSALDYERVLQAKIVSFEMLASANVQAEARAQQFASLVDAQHELLSNLQQQALPVTASALEMGLQQGVALRDGLLAAGVRDATRKAQDIFGANLEGATGAQTRLEVENLDQMRAAIAALGKAQSLIVDRTDQAIERGLTSLELVEQVKVSAGAVRTAMADFQKVDSGLANRDAPAEPAA